MQDTKALPITSPVTLSDLEALGGSSIPAPLLSSPRLPPSPWKPSPSFYFPFLFFLYPASLSPSHTYVSDLRISSIFDLSSPF